MAAFTAPRASVIALLGIAALILLRHEGNLRRLLRREEGSGRGER